MKETAAKRRDKAGRDRESKAEKSKEPAPQDVEMPEEEAASAAKPPGELDGVTLDGKPNQISDVVVKSQRPVPDHWSWISVGRVLGAGR